MYICIMYVFMYVCLYYVRMYVCVCIMYVFIACSITCSNTISLIVIFTNTMFIDNYTDCFIPRSSLNLHGLMDLTVREVYQKNVR